MSTQAMMMAFHAHLASAPGMQANQAALQAMMMSAHQTMLRMAASQQHQHQHQPVHVQPQPQVQMPAPAPVAAPVAPLVPQALQAAPPVVTAAPAGVPAFAAARPAPQPLAMVTRVPACAPPKAAAVVSRDDGGRRDKSLALLTENFMAWCDRKVTKAVAAGYAPDDLHCCVELDDVAAALSEWRPDA